MKARLLLSVLLAFGCLVPPVVAQDVVAQDKDKDKDKDKHPDNEKGDEPNPRLVVPSIDEPDVALDGKTSERADFVAPIQGGGFIFERRDGDGKRLGGVVVPGVIMVNRGLVELFGCGEGGKEHETIFRLETNIQGSEVVLRLARRYGRKVLLASTSEVYGKSVAIPPTSRPPNGTPSWWGP